MYDVTHQEILERMLDRVSDKFDKREGSVIFDTHSPAALELEILYMELNRLIAESYGDTASREYLVLRCRERGIIPHPATNAVLKGVFTPATVDVTGKRFNLGSLNYVVTKKTAPGEYEVQCETPGTAGNQYTGQIIPIEYVDGLETAELTEVLIPGEDEEDTEDLRQRYFDSFDEQAFGGNVRDYIEKINAIDGVGATKVTRVWNGDIRPADMIPNSAVDAWYAETVESLSTDCKAWLKTVYSAAKEKKLTVGGTVLVTILDSNYKVPTPTLINTVQTALDPVQNAGEGSGIAPIGHVVNVKAATGVKINVYTDITFKDSNYNWTNLQSQIEAAIEAYLEELRKSWAGSTNLTVRIAQIESGLLKIDGIIDAAGTQINGVASNLLLKEYEVPVMGGVTHGS